MERKVKRMLKNEETTRKTKEKKDNKVQEMKSALLKDCRTIEGFHFEFQNVISFVLEWL